MILTFRPVRLALCQAMSLRLGRASREFGSGSTQLLRPTEFPQPLQMPRIGYSETFLNLASVEAAAVHETSFPSRASDYGPNFRGFLERGRSISALDYVKANALKAELVGMV